MSSASGVGGDPAGLGPNVLGHSASVVGRASRTQQRQPKRAAVTSEETRRAGAQRTGGGRGWGRARAAGRGLIRRKRRWLRDSRLSWMEEVSAQNPALRSEPNAVNEHPTAHFTNTASLF